MPTHLVRQIKDFGLDVEPIGQDCFRIANPSGNLSTFMPLSDQEKAQDHIDVKYHRLKALADFLHHPVGAVSEDLQAPEMEEPLFAVMRYMATNSTTFQGQIVDENEGKESAECHAETEKKLRAEDAKIQDPQFGNDENSPNSVIYSKIDPKRGFSLQIAPKFLDEKSHATPEQRALRDRILAALEQAHVTIEPSLKAPRVYFTREQLNLFCGAVAQPDLPALTQTVEIQHEAAKNISEIDQKAADIERDRNIQLLLQDHAKSGDSKERLHRLLKATTALTPMVDSEEMHKIWARARLTRRGKSPLENLAHDFAVLNETLKHYDDVGVSNAVLQATIDQFYHLLVFSKDFAETLQTGLGRRKATKYANTQTQSLKDNLFDYVDALEDASAVPLALESEFQNEDYQEVLEVLETAIGTDDPIHKKAKKAAVGAVTAFKDVTVDFAMDIMNFPKDRPITALVVLALIAPYIYHKIQSGAYTQGEAKEFVDQMLSTDWSGNQTTMNIQNGQIKIDKNQYYHIHDFIFFQMRHYMGIGYVESLAHALINLPGDVAQLVYERLGIPFDAANTFSQVADARVEPTSRFLYISNVWQDLSHLPLWAYLFEKGRKFGFKSAGAFVEMSGPIIDPVYRMGSNAVHAIKGDEQLHLRILQIAGQTYDPLMPEVETDAPKRSWLPKLKMPSLFEKPVVRGLHMAYPDSKLDAEAYQKMQTALRRFESNIKGLAAAKGFDENERYHAYLGQKLEAVRDAMERHKNDPKAMNRALRQNLQVLIGAELRHSGHSEIYEAQTGPHNDLTSRQEGRLSRLAAKAFGRAKRWDRMCEQFNRLTTGKTMVANENGQEQQHSVTWFGKAVSLTKLAATSIQIPVTEGLWYPTRWVGAQLRKKRVFLPFLAASAASVAIDFNRNAQNDLARYVSPETAETIVDTAHEISRGSGHVVGTGTTGALYAVWNFGQDVGYVHLILGGLTLAAGTGVGIGLRRGARPAMLKASEVFDSATGLDLQAHTTRFFDTANRHIKTAQNAIFSQTKPPAPQMS